jgi:hypothetical protein
MSLRFRQVHLDFHTSQHIGGIGADFDPDRFGDALRDAHVDSVTLFSRCHHGYIYHDTKFPFRHPHLERNLLAEQIRACHARDIRCPIYITVGWDELQASLHPEWREVRADGKLAGAGPTQAGWRKLCMGSPYLDYVVEQTEEVLDLFGDEVDGFFFDIIFVDGAHSQYALDEYRRRGLNPENEADIRQMKSILVERYMTRITEAVRAKAPKVGIFHNSGHVSPQFRNRMQFFSHLEVESLPTGGWGYNHLPTTARYARTLSDGWLGMTGKFSETWGHFNSYKNPAALEFECFSAIALGGRCSVGDQLHPRGELDAPTYDLIGGVFSQIAEREPWLQGAKVVSDVAVLSAESVPGVAERSNAPNVGVVRALTELQVQFDFVDFETPLDSYRLLILPDFITVEGAFLDRVNAFVAAGGRVLATGNSGFGINGFPVEKVGDLLFSPDYVKFGDITGVMYERGVEVRALDGAEVLATVANPYFDRNYLHFCSHAHSPIAEQTEISAAVFSGSFGYLSHPIFSTYAEHAMTFHRNLLAAVLDRLLPEPLVRLTGPRSIQAHVHSLGEKTVVHLLHYIPERRGLKMDVVEDRMSLAGALVSVAGEFASARLEPHGLELDLHIAEGRSEATLPNVAGHTMLVLSR